MINFEGVLSKKQLARDIKLGVSHPTKGTGTVHSKI